MRSSSFSRRSDSETRRSASALTRFSSAICRCCSAEPPAFAAVSFMGTGDWLETKSRGQLEVECTTRDPFRQARGPPAPRQRYRPPAPALVQFRAAGAARHFLHRQALPAASWRGKRAAAAACFTWLLQCAPARPLARAPQRPFSRLTTLYAGCAASASALSCCFQNSEGRRGSRSLRVLRMFARTRRQLRRTRCPASAYRDSDHMTSRIARGTPPRLRRSCSGQS